jgi:hypothetical protein
MLTRRIIACLDVRDGRVVKGIQFVDLIDAGDPAALAHRHAQEGADEIVLLDITATHEGRGHAARYRPPHRPFALRTVHGWRRYSHRLRRGSGL